MTIRSFKDAWELNMKKFAVYTLSLVAALSVNVAVQSSTYYNRYNKTLLAFFIVLFSITLISFITYLDPSDEDSGDNNKDNKYKIGNK